MSAAQDKAQYLCPDGQAGFCDTLFLQVVPVIGAITGILLSGSSVPAMFKVRQSNDLDALNPLPFVLLLGNNLAWITYGLYESDAAVVAPNIVSLGLVIVFLTTIHTACRSPRMRNIIDALSMTLTIFVLFMATLAFWGRKNNKFGHATGNEIIGYTCNLVLIVFYASPLSTLYNVIKTKDTSSISLPLSITCIVNGTLWVLYGIAKLDKFQLIANSIGTLIGITQVVLRITLGNCNSGPRGVMEHSRRVGSPSSAPDSIEELAQADIIEPANSDDLLNSKV